MSIWCSWPPIGHDPYDDPDAPGGEVRTYAAGFSNHHPDASGTHELPAHISLAHIAPWCVPGHDQDAPGYRCTGCSYAHDGWDVGPWLRLGLYADDSLEFARDRQHHTGPIATTVVLDYRAARALRDQLNDWLARPKVNPREEA